MLLGKPIFLFALILPTLALEQANGWTYSSPTATGACGNLDETGSAGDFSFTSIVHKSLYATPGVSDVLKMAFVMPTDTSTHADIIFIERFGEVKYYDAAAKSLTLIGTVPKVSTVLEDGLVGVAVERPFRNRVYVVYSRGTGPNYVINGSLRLSRFSMDAATRMLDMNSEKVILDVPSARGRLQTSGALAADLEGNLYWAVGDNGTLFTGPGNTHDLRGSILRIHPKEDGNGYTIPPGNFAEHWANTFTGQGRSVLAAEYRDTSLVRPEIYVKGIREAYSISVDPYRKQVVYGQCSPDYSGNTEVHTNTLTPIFAGWPFWLGTITVTGSQPRAAYYSWSDSVEPNSDSWSAYFPASKEYPVNTWTGTLAGTPGPGVDTLPPYTAPKHIYNRSCALGSVILRYDGRIRNPGQLPPQMDNVWLMGDYVSRKLAAAKVDTNGTLVETVKRNPGIFTTGLGTAGGVNALVDLQQGPDGALYVANLNCNGGVSSGATRHSDACSGILRIEYTGSCADTGFYPRNPTTGIRNAERIERGVVDWVWVGPGKFSVMTEGPHSIRIWDVQGRETASMRGEGRKHYPMPEKVAPNKLFILEVKTNRGVNRRSFLRP